MPRTPVPPAPTSGVIPPPNGSTGPLGGATYGPGEKLQPISMPSYIAFDFNLPKGWGCLHTENKPLDKRITCMDEANVGGAAGWIGSSRCADGCGKSAQDKVRGKLPVDAQAWKPIDDVTSYARMTGTLGNGMRVVRIAMTCAFASTPGGPATRWPSPCSPDRPRPRTRCRRSRTNYGREFRPNVCCAAACVK
ncbi:hypothetical protein R2351_00655 [Mycobacteroides chelonae]|nr:hypothetical protein [Mycobacteroides chelonae]